MTLAELDAADERRRARFRYRLSLVVLLVAAVVAGLLLWRDLRDDRPHAAVGSTYDSGNALPTQWRRTVLVPGTRYDVTAALRDDVTDDPEVHARQAPDDGTFVALSIVESRRPGPNVPDDNGTTGERAGPRFTLIADGRRYALAESDSPLAPPSGAARPTRLPVNGWLAVAGSADRLSLETTWQGRTQRLDLRSGDRVTGDFAALYRQRSVGRVPVATTSCGPATWTPGWRAGPGVPLACSYRADRLAWTATEGWAKPGRQWLALTTTTSVPSYLIRRVGARDLPYRPGLVDSSATSFDVSESPDRLDGTRPVSLRQVRDIGENETAVTVFDVARSSATHTAVLTQAAGVRSRIDHSDANYYDGGVRQTWTVRIPA